jgi:DNA polymerase elongation subunit (family B)
VPETQPVKPMWSAIHHDQNSGHVFVWYTDGKRYKYPVKHRFFTPDRNQYGSYPCGMKDIYGNDMYEVIVSGKEEQDIKNQHSGRYNKLAECDVDFRTRWLQHQYEDQGDIRFNFKDINICFLDIEVATKGRFPTAERADYPVNCVTVYFSKEDIYYTLGLNREIREDTAKKLADENCAYINCPTEVDLLTKLFMLIGENQVDIITGWNSDFYDFPYLVNRAQKLEVDIRRMSRLPGSHKCAYISKRDNALKIGGTEVIDFLKLYRKYTFSERDNFKLDTIGEVEVGERKAPLPDGYMSWVKYWDEFVLYNFQDVRLMKRIEEHCRMFETTVTACSEARVPFSAIFEAKKMLVGFLLNYLHQHNLTLPPLRENEREWFPGAYVYSTPGYYDKLVSYDYRSMYPSIMMGANISPETKVTYGIDEIVPPEALAKLVRSPWTANGKRQVFYRKDIVGIVPQVVKILFDGRSDLKKKMKEALKAGDQALADYYDMKQKTYKILGNSLYGLLGNPFFQLYDIDNSATITAFGRELIQSTIKELCEYFEKYFRDDPRFEILFGQKPTIDEKLLGTFEGVDGLSYHRISHGDTDSFFVKYTDFYSDFEPKVGNEVEVLVFDGNQLISSEKFGLANGETEAKKAFNAACTTYVSDWKKMSVSKKKRAFAEGIIFGDKSYRIIYNRYLLTDFCRVLDAGLMEDVLAGIMENYANRWNYYENTIFLKREKCIHQAIVTAKKKYICRVESNEDAKYFDKKKAEQDIYELHAKFAITGMEIVRSSTTPFARERILGLINKMFENRNKGYIRKEYLKIKKEFFDYVNDGKIYEISIPSGVKKDPPKWVEYVNWSAEDKKAVDWRLRSSSVWNYLIENDEILSEMPLEPIFEASKVKFIKVGSNKFGIKSIAYVGDKCPDRLLEIFNPNWDEQWTKTFAQTMDKIFIAIGWGKNLEADETDNLIEFL